MIAISYRRDDSLPIAGRLYDRLQAKFGQKNVFMDFDSIPPGVDFREQIKQTIERSKLVIAVIGPRWLGEQSDSSRRIDDPADFVRLEIKYALKQGVPIIPLLVDNTLMPRPEKLPPDIEGLAFRNALPLDSGLDFHNHAERLINGIYRLVDVNEMQKGHTLDGGTIRSAKDVRHTAPAGQSRRSKILVWSVIGVIVAVGVALIGWFIANNHPEGIDKTQQKVATQESTPAGSSQPAPTLAIVPQPAAAPTASSQGSDATQNTRPSATEASQPIESMAGPPHPIRPKTISIENGAVSVDGALVQDVESVLGKPERIESGRSSGAEIDIWDSIGLRVYPNETGKPYRRLDVFFSDENKVTSCPKMNFQGELLVDGFSVSSTTNIKALNASLGSKALIRTERGGSPLYTGQYGKGAIEVLCNHKGLIQTISVLPGGLPTSEPLPETPEQRSVKTKVVSFLDAVKKGDLRAAYKHFQNTPNDPKGLTVEGFTSFIRQDEAFSQIRSYRITVTNDSWGMVFWANVEVTCTDGRQRQATIEMLRNEKDFGIDQIQGATHGFPEPKDPVSPSIKRIEVTSSITKDMVREFVKKFVSANQSYPPDAALALYAPKVRYRDEGERDLGYIRKDLEKDHKRWPIRRDKIEGDIKVDERVSGREYGASFNLGFYVESPERHEWIKGQSAVDLSAAVVDSEFKISAIKEKALHRETGKFPSDLASNGTLPTPRLSPTQIASPPSEGGKRFAGTWEGVNHYYSKDGKEWTSNNLRVIINESETEVKMTSGGPDWIKGWVHSAPRTLSNRNYKYIGCPTVMTLNDDGTMLTCTAQAGNVLPVRGNTSKYGLRFVADGMTTRASLHRVK